MGNNHTNPANPKQFLDGLLKSPVPNMMMSINEKELGRRKSLPGTSVLMRSGTDGSLANDEATKLSQISDNTQKPTIENGELERKNVGEPKQRKSEPELFIEKIEYDSDEHPQKYYIRINLNEYYVENVGILKCPAEIAKQLAECGLSCVPFQYTEGLFKNEEKGLPYLNRRANEIARIKDLVHYMTKGIELKEALALSAKVHKKTNVKFWKKAPSEQNLEQEKLLRHKAEERTATLEKRVAELESKLDTLVTLEKENQLLKLEMKRHGIILDPDQLMSQETADQNEIRELKERLTMEQEARAEDLETISNLRKNEDRLQRQSESFRATLVDKDAILTEMNKRIKALEQSDLSTERNTNLEAGNKEANADHMKNQVLEALKELLPLFLEPFLNQIREVSSLPMQNGINTEATRKNSIPPDHKKGRGYAEAAKQGQSSQLGSTKQQGNQRLPVPAQQSRNKKNLRVDINQALPSRLMQPPTADSIGTASSLLPFGRTPEQGGSNGRNPPRVEEEYDQRSTTMSRKEKRMAKNHKTSILVIPKKNGTDVYNIIRQTPGIQQRWITQHFQYPSGTVLINCTSPEKAGKIKEILSTNTEIHMKEKQKRNFEVRIHNIKMDYDKEEISTDIFERFKEHPSFITLVPYKKIPNRGFAVVTVSKNLFERMEKVKTIRIDFESKRINTQVYIPRCTNCHLLGHKEKHCSRTEVEGNLENSGKCWDCLEYNKRIDPENRRKGYQRSPNHATGAPNCATLIAFQLKWKPVN